MIYTIEPVAELNGEGNGWDNATEALATLWLVGTESEIVASFDTRAQAEQWIKANSAQ